MFNKSIAQNPKYADAHSNIGNALRGLDQIDKAVESYKHAIAINPNTVDTYYNLGNLLNEQNELVEAVIIFKKAIEIEPKHKSAHNGLGNALSGLGKIDEAIMSYREAIKYNSENIEAYRSLSANKKFSEYDEDINAMESLHAKGTLSDDQKMHISFGLEKAYEDIGEYEKSMEFILQATRLKRASYEYSISDTEDLFSRIKTIFTTDIFADRKCMGDPGQTPIFILGMPRSGTSLVEQLLASHSQVHGAGELDAMNKLVYPVLSNLSDQKVSPDSSEISQNDIIAVRDGYLEALAALNVSERIITDKLPLNFLFIGFILSAFPKAKNIHVNRSPRATCWSIYRHYFSGKGNGYAYDMATLAKFYRLYIDLMAFWRERFLENIYDLNYENLTENQEQETHKLLLFCDLQWEEQCLDFHDNKRVVKTASNARFGKRCTRVVLMPGENMSDTCSLL